MNFQPASTRSDTLSAYVALMNECFPRVAKFNLAYLHWLYAANPDGPVFGFDAIDGDQIAAHYACIPAVAEIDGSPVRVLLSLNTATRPQHQGKGLFTKLASMTFASAQDAGFGAVYGVANASSTPGFVRKLDFQLVAPLDARLGFGKLLTHGITPDVQPSFRMVHTSDSLVWRCNNPSNRVFIKKSNRQVQCYASAVRGLISAYHEFSPQEIPTIPSATPQIAPLRLFIGKVPAGCTMSRWYFPIPNRLRPSPLNLIYRSLSGNTASLDPDRLSFSFIDFDAF